MPLPSVTQLAKLALLSAAVFLLAFSEYRKLPDHHAVTIRFFDVGQGDSIFITGPTGEKILIDGGPDFSALEGLGSAMPFFDRTIDLLVLTHPHLDHVAAFPEIMRRYHMKHVMLAGAVYDNGPYEEFLSLLHNQQTPLIIPKPGQKIDLHDGLVLHLLWPPPIYFGKTVTSIHDSCIAFKMTYGKDSILFTGDMEEAAEKVLIKERADLASTVLKVGHHGSKTSSGTGFLLAVHPKLAVISVAAQNSYGLPNPMIMKRLRDLHIPIETTMSGMVMWKMDGEEGL